MKKIFIFLTSFYFLISSTLANENIFIVAKINNNIITSLDLKKEIAYLHLLNPQLENLDQKNQEKIAKNSLINEIIKKNELKKFFEFNKKISIIDEAVENFYKNLGFSSKKNFEQFLNKKNTYKISEIEKKVKIDFFWNRMILDIYDDQIKIDEDKLIKKINNTASYKNEYLLSEIFFKKDQNLSLKEKVEAIKQSIKNVGFSNTASIYSISNSGNSGGKIGWVDEENLSEIITKELKNIEEGQFTNVIQIGNNFLILKIEEKKTKKIEADKKLILKQMIEFEKNKQLNQFSQIYFNKIKVNYEINEK